MIKFAAGSHPGRKRDHNEDYYRADPELGLWLVADGVGGHANGEVAARIVGDSVVEKLTAGEDLENAVLEAHAAVLKEIASRDSSNMGSTVVALRLQDDRYEICWVGDSRAYLYNGILRQLTRDHNPVNELLARGAITPEQAAIHPERHVLSQSLGVSDSIRVKPGHVRGKLEAGQQFLLCSDGLTDELDDTAIAAQLKVCTTPDEQVKTLIDQALAAGGRDNVTVIVVGEAGATRRSTSKSPPGDMSTRELVAVTEQDAGQRSPHDRKVWLLMSVMGALAALWVLLRVF